MRKRLSLPLAALSLLTFGPLLRADEVKGADRLLCSTVAVLQCTDDGTCADELPWNVNVPQFVEVDLAAKKVQSTKASGENRASTVDVKRDSGLVVLQGFENGRAFSFVINEKTGRASVAVAREGMVVSVFASCTPLAASTAATK